MDYNDELKAILDISIALSAEKNRNKLFDMIITRSMDISSCDAGTLYLLENNTLVFTIMKTLSQNVDKGADGEKIDIPPVELKEENICAYAAIHRQVLNIPDVYDNDMFDFSGPQKYDAITGYRTGSMLVIPLIDSEENVVGVLQLMNALDNDGQVIPFNESIDRVIFALSSQAAIAVSNLRYRQELKDQMWSFTEAMAAAIDERTPYNASHTRHVANYCGMMVDYINELHDKGLEEEFFSESRREQLVMGALLHDIGKLVIPLSVMNKATRLGERYDTVVNRIETIALKARIARLENKLDDEKYDIICSRITEAKQLISDVDSIGYLNDELYEKVLKICDYVYEDTDERIGFFTDEEKACLKVRRGTLTEEERRIMESHVVITSKLLSKVHFNSYFINSPVWAGQHHECINGSGYPNGLKGEELSVDARIMAVADICDALLATDRPYKKPIPPEKAIAIMRDMAGDGKIDGKLVEYMAECLKRAGSSG